MLRTKLEKDELKAAKKVMRYLVDTKSIKPMEYVGMIKFKLKEEYLEKLIELDEKYPEIIEEFFN